LLNLSRSIQALSVRKLVIETAKFSRALKHPQTWIGCRARKSK
jgi:hypothetical protein